MAFHSLEALFKTIYFLYNISNIKQLSKQVPTFEYQIYKKNWNNNLKYNQINKQKSLTPKIRLEKNEAEF